jgi:hypothetical protein
MKLQSIHRQLNCSAKQAGFMPTYWSLLSSNDRTPEICPGSSEGAGYA